MGCLNMARRRDHTWGRAICRSFVRAVAAAAAADRLQLLRSAESQSSLYVYSVHWPP